MPKNDDESFRQRREREEREELEQRSEETELLKKQSTPQKIGSIEGNTDRLNEHITQAEPLIEQLNHLYNQFFSGAEKLPPTERRTQLEQVMNLIHLMSKPTVTIQFRCNTLWAHFVANRDRWDKKMKDFEMGKLKRGI